MPTRPSRANRANRPVQTTAQRPMFCPFTTGGDRLAIEKVANFGVEHFEQRDKSLNRKLWSMFQLKGDWNAGRFDTLHDRHTDSAYEIMDFANGTQYGPFDLERLTRAISDFELGHIAGTMAVLGKIEMQLFNYQVLGEPTDKDLEEMGIPVTEALWERQQLDNISPLSDAIVDATSHKALANEHFAKRQYLDAMREYVRALLALYPWTGSPLIFTGKEAFELGIAPLEGIIWSNMAMTCQRLAETLNEQRWIHACRGCCQVLLEMRYATPLLYTKTFKRMADTAKIFVQQGEAIYQYELGVTERSLQKVQSAIDADPENASKRWAHSGCWERHSTCIGVNTDEEAAAKQQAFVENSLRQEAERQATVSAGAFSLSV